MLVLPKRYMYRLKYIFAFPFCVNLLVKSRNVNTCHYWIKTKASKITKLSTSQLPECFNLFFAHLLSFFIQKRGEQIMQFVARLAGEVKMLILKNTHLSSHLSGGSNANEPVKVVFINH